MGGGVSAIAKFYVNSPCNIWDGKVIIICYKQGGGGGDVFGTLFWETAVVAFCEGGAFVSFLYLCEGGGG